MDQERLFSYLAQGYNCSQTVTAYFAEQYSLEPHTAKRIAEAFESGLFSGGVCGAVLGAYMILGLATGSDNADHRTQMKERVQEFNRRFIEQTGSLQCKELLGCDISDDSVLKQAFENGTIQKVCPAAISAAVSILEQFFLNGASGVSG